MEILINTINKMAKKYIKKVKRSEIQDLLGIYIAPNKVSMGFDVAMRNTGIAVIRTTDSSIILDQVHKIIVPKGLNLLDSIDLFLSQLEDFRKKITQKYKLDFNIIEDCFLGKNVNTLKSLARHSILVYDRFKTITTKTKLILPKSARSKIKFKKSSKSIKGDKLKKEILKYINSLLGTKITDYDISDAVVLGLCGLIEEIN